MKLRDFYAQRLLFNLFPRPVKKIKRSSEHRYSIIEVDVLIIIINFQTSGQQVTCKCLHARSRMQIVYALPRVGTMAMAEF